VLVQTVSETFAEIVSGVVTLVVPSLTTTDSAPPGIAGIATEVWKTPLACVMRQPPTTRLLAVPLPPFAKDANGEAQVAALEPYQFTVVVPTVLTIEIGLAARKPEPLTTSVVPTV
jgi:hypothetical protein